MAPAVAEQTRTTRARLEEPKSAPTPAEAAERYVDVGIRHALGLLNMAFLENSLGRHGRKYSFLMEAGHEIERLKQHITREHGPAVIEELRADNAHALVPSEGEHDCEVTAHPAGGYTLLFRDRTIAGKYGTRQDAARFARINGFGLKEQGA